MLSTGAFLEAMVPLYIMAFIGFFSRKIHVFNRQANQVITQLMLYVTLPALILFSLNVTFTMDLFASFSWLIVMSIFMLIIAILVARMLRNNARLPQRQRHVYESLIIFGNQGFIGFAVSYILMGEEGIVYLTFFNICYLILIWTYGIYLFTKKQHSMSWRRLFLNPGILATMLGLGMMFMPFQWPHVLIETFESVGKMTIPLSMILIGSLFADMSRSEVQQYSKNIYMWIAVGCRLIVLPLCLLVFLFLHVPYPLLVIAVLTSAMPSASTTTAYAQAFGGDAAFTSYGVLLSTLLCILTIPLVYTLITYLYPFF